jgi:conjugal transfer ATP-binding protein TraC
VINYPKRFELHQVAQMLGDATQGSKGYPCPFLITMGAQIIDFDQHKSNTDLKTARAIQLAESPMAKMLPNLVSRANDWKLMQKSYDAGAGGIRLYHQILMFPHPDKATQADEAVRAVWRSMGFTLTSDMYMQIQALMSSLPMALSPVMLKDISHAQRLSTKTLENAASLSPVLGEWCGMGDPVLAMMGRNGQTIGVDIFSNTAGNFNGIVVGTSGSGKSALLNEIATRYLAAGAKVWIIDVGRSYEKLCKSLGGQYLEFNKEADISLNPFTMVNDIDEDMEMLKPLLAQMISPSRKLSDYELSQLEANVRELWDEYGPFMTIDLLADQLKSFSGDDVSDTRVRDMGVQLYPYRSHGSYGKYFNGPHTVNFNSNMVVLELEELKSKKDLQAVALFILMYRITQEMYLAPRDQPKVVIMDEAWDLLTGGQSGEFIEAGYRRARKYGGGFLTGTQGINDYERSVAALASMENADWIFMLRQKQESIARLETKLAFTPHMVDLVASLRTEQGSYSEIFVSCGQAGYGVGVFSMDKFSQLMGSANARDFTAVRDKQALGMTMAEAIDAVLMDRGQDEQ